MNDRGFTLHQSHKLKCKSKACIESKTYCLLSKVVCVGGNKGTWALNYQGGAILCFFLWLCEMDQGLWVHVSFRLVGDCHFKVKYDGQCTHMSASVCYMLRYEFKSQTALKGIMWAQHLGLRF